MAFYGDVFRPRAGAELTDPELAEIAQRTGITDAVMAVAGDAGLAGLTKAIGREQVNRTIAQLGRYFDDQAKRKPLCLAAKFVHSGFAARVAANPLDRDARRGES